VSRGREWLATAGEWALLGIALGCLGTWGYATLEGRLIQRDHVARFQNDAAERRAFVQTPGSLVGMLDVPRLRMSAPVVEGDDDQALKAAAGHLPDTPLPWNPGNSAIAGHRDGLFRPLKGVKVGDEITFRTTRDALHYRVTSTVVVQPGDLSVLAPRGRDVLTLITCYPFSYVGAAPQRFVIHAERVTAAAPAAETNRGSATPASN
jgi:sortase A